MDSFDQMNSSLLTANIDLQVHDQYSHCHLTKVCSEKALDVVYSERAKNGSTFKCHIRKKLFCLHKPMLLETTVVFIHMM